jgi:carotenoid 1,2-hydratase
MRFDREIKPGGYVWWYMDAISDDGTQAMTLIAFIGSVFSPYYAWANRKSPASAENFCAMNVVLYERRGGYWAMTERARKSLRRSMNVLQIGPSALQWDGSVLRAEIDERCAPVPRRLRGRIALTPGVIHEKIFELDARGRHRWRPIAPRARIDVAFDAPGISWSGNAYWDCNEGDAPLAEDFSEWHWSRGDGRILYDVTCKDGTTRGLALRVATDGGLENFEPPPLCDLPTTFWRVRRRTRADSGRDALVVKTLEDAPFYARSLVSTAIAGEAITCVHESLSLTRFSSPVIRALLPFRMPRFG